MYGSVNQLVERGRQVAKDRDKNNGRPTALELGPNTGWLRALGKTYSTSR